MVNFSDSLMYIRYIQKNIYLNYLKKIKKLDYTGRIENTSATLHGYEGCYPVNIILKRLNITQNDNIIDIGCGKGLFLFYASRFKFKRIDGLEYSSKLASIALRNSKVLRDRRIHIYHCDARHFAKYDQYNYFFINNPFSREIMEEVVLKLVESYFSNKRKIVVIYQFPFNQDIFAAQGFKILFNKFPNSLLTFG